MQISIIDGIFDRALMQTATIAAPALSDESLFMAFGDGDEDAFRSLYTRHRDRVWRFVLRLVRDPAQAEEVAQEVWLAVIAGSNTFAERAKFTTWLFAIAHRCSARRLRGLLRNPESIVEDFDDVADPHEAGTPPDAVAQQGQDAARLRAAIARLPLAQREAFLLRAEGGLAIAQIALVVGCPAETAKTRCVMRTQNCAMRWGARHDRDMVRGGARATVPSAVRRRVTCSYRRTSACGRAKARATATLDASICARTALGDGRGGGPGLVRLGAPCRADAAGFRPN